METVSFKFRHITQSIWKYEEWWINFLQNLKKIIRKIFNQNQLHYNQKFLAYQI